VNVVFFLRGVSPKYIYIYIIILGTIVYDLKFNIVVEVIKQKMI